MYRAPPKSMRKVGLRELHRRTGDLVVQLEKGGEPFVITKHGRPVAVLFPCAMDAPEKPIIDFEPPLAPDAPRGASATGVPAHGRQ